MITGSYALISALRLLYSLLYMQTNFVYLNFLTAKNEQYFPNPERFDPARWARDKPNPFAVLPFGFGPRSCYGESYHYTKCTYIILYYSSSNMQCTAVHLAEKTNITDCDHITACPTISCIFHGWLDFMKLLDMQSTDKISWCWIHKKRTTNIV